MYDKKYLESGNVKEPETVGEALAALAIGAKMCTKCSECPMRMYETSKGGSCSEAQKRLVKFIAEKVGLDNDNTVEAAIELYDAVAEMFATPDSKPKEQNDAKTCENCFHSKMHSSGIRYCENFGNFVHEDGYCYRFEWSDNIVDTVCG